MTQADDRLHRLLGDESLAWLVRRARDRIETGRSLSGPVTLTAATVEQRRAVERLTGRAAGSGASLTVSLTEVDRILRASGAAPGDRLGGRVRGAGCRRRRPGRAGLLAGLAGRDRRDAPAGARARSGPAAPWPGRGRTVAAAVGRHPDRPARRRVLRRRARLDDGRPVGTLALSAARALAGLPFAAPGSADSRRAAWATAGVHLDELSSLVLCLGLPGDSRTILGQMLALGRQSGQPTVVTLRQLRCHPGALSAVPVPGPPSGLAGGSGGLVRICENPVVVAAAADQLGAACPPLICVGGQPSAAVWRMLELLVAGGARFAYHGDFDWGGVRIASAVRQRVSWLPWRYDHVAYASALTAVPGRELELELELGQAGNAGLGPDSAETPWDPDLAVAMRQHNVRVEEELVLDALLQDLSGYE